MILFFTSPIGLGHATRDIAIAEKLGFTEDKILFITGKAAYNIISNKGYLAYDAYCPHEFNVDHLMQLYSPIKWILQYIQYYRKCKIIAEDYIINNINNNNDGLIISDEDFASVAIGEKLKRKRILITDLTETHFVKGTFSLIEAVINRSLKNMIKKCNHVIIPDFGDDNDNISYVGPIVRELSNRDRIILRKNFGMDKQTILVSIGGTGAGKYLIEMATKAYKRLKRRMDIDMIVASGPSSLEMYNNNNYCPTFDSFKNIGFVDNLHEYVYASDLIVSLAGKSTIDESLVYGTPGIFIPIKNHFEQEKNAEKLGYKYDDIFRLESLIEEKITTNRCNRCNIKNGVEKAARIVLEMLE